MVRFNFLKYYLFVVCYEYYYTLGFVREATRIWLAGNLYKNCPSIFNIGRQLYSEFHIQFLDLDQINAYFEIKCFNYNTYIIYKSGDNDFCNYIKC